MTDSESLLNISYEEDIDESDTRRLYIDETIFHCENSSNQQSTKSTNTGNPFELDFLFLVNLNRYQTRSSQTLLTSHINHLFKRHRSTLCQAEYFTTISQQTNTEHDDQEERIPVMKKQRLSVPSSN